MQLRSLLRKPIFAAFLSAIFPGAGQAFAGQPSRGAIVAVPALAVAGAIIAIPIFFRGSLLDSAFNQQLLTSLLFLDMVALIYHAWAVVDSYILAGKPAFKEQRRRRSANKSVAPIFGLAAIIVVIVGVHGGLAALDLSWQNGISNVSGDRPNWVDPVAAGQTIAMTTDNPEVVLDPSGSGGTPAPTITFDPSATFDPNALPSYAAPTEAKNWAADGQLNILLAGIDSGVGGGRSQGLRPDTMIVLHVDIASGRAAMIGIPRNTMCVPLPQAIAQHYATPTNGCPAYTWPYMLNWLANEAGWNHPANFPFYQGDGLEYMRAMTATEQAIGALTGLTIDGFVVINLQGLVTLIDDLGGIQITVPKTVSDYPCGPAGTWAAQWRVCDICGSTCATAARIHYGYSVPDDTGAVIPHMKADAANPNTNGLQEITWSSSADIAFTVKAGAQHMDGDWALAYARTRIYSTDYDRMMRQQLVLKSMRTTFDPCTILPRVPSLLNHLGLAFWTNLPLTDASKWAGMAKNIFGGNVKSITLDPTSLGSGGTYINSTTWGTAKSLVGHSLDGLPAGGGSGGGGGGGFSC